MRRRSLLGLVLLLGSADACGPGRLEARVGKTPPQAAVSERVGAGFVLTRPPPGLTLPRNASEEPVSPKVTDDFAQPPTSNDFWSSLIWQYDIRGDNPYSQAIYAHPLTLKANAFGLSIGYPTQPTVTSLQYMYLHSGDVLVGLDGMRSSDTRVSGYSDWAVTAVWHDQKNELRATFGHGLPFAYFIRKGTAPAKVTPSRETLDHKKLAVRVWHHAEEWLGITVADRNYMVFAPKGSEWLAAGDSFVSDLGDKDYFSVAIVPDTEPATLALFREHAYAFVENTQVSWEYDEKAATLRTRFALTTELKEPGLASEPLLALYPHQWRNTKAPLLGKSYVSPRGEMKLLRASSFSTELRFNGVLPILPNVARDLDEDDLEYFVKQTYWQNELFPKGLGANPQRDAYWDGKTFQKLANVLQIADQIGYASARDHLLQAIKNEFDDWFDGREPRAFYYDKTWRSLITTPEAFFSGAELNDHHFQYGYFVFTAAIVAKYDPSFVSRYGDYIDLLIKDAANWNRSDERFPFLRHMDVYAGHSWANGPALFEEGNNEESSSEDVNFSAACILWGAITQNREIRDLGIFLYTQQVSAIEQYWWDIDRQVFPKGFEHSAVAMVWGDGARYETWWDPNPIFVHGINIMPITAGSLYMGRHPEYVLQNYSEVVRRNKRDPLTWRDLLWMYLAFADPERAKRLLEDKPYFTPEFGNSTAMTYHFIYNLAALGRLEPSVTADTPTYAVFENGRQRSHLAFNPTRKPLAVSFSDGVNVSVAPLRTAHAVTTIGK